MNDEQKFLKLEKTCPSCGKLFFITAHGCWTYKINRGKHGRHKYDYYCSYTCYLRAQERSPRRRKVTGVYLPNLRRIMDRLNLTYKSAEEKTGVNGSNLQKYANLYARATMETVEQIAAGLGVTADELIGEEKKKEDE